MWIALHSMNSKDLYSVNLDGVDGMKKLFSFVLGVLVLCGLSGAVAF